MSSSSQGSAGSVAGLSNGMQGVAGLPLGLGIGALSRGLWGASVGTTTGAFKLLGWIAPYAPDVVPYLGVLLPLTRLLFGPLPQQQQQLQQQLPTLARFTCTQTAPLQRLQQASRHRKSKQLSIVATQSTPAKRYAAPTVPLPQRKAQYLRAHTCIARGKAAFMLPAVPAGWYYQHTGRPVLSTLGKLHPQPAQAMATKTGSDVPDVPVMYLTAGLQCSML